MSLLTGVVVLVSNQSAGNISGFPRSYRLITRVLGKQVAVFPSTVSHHSVLHTSHLLTRYNADSDLTDDKEQYRRKRFYVQAISRKNPPE